MTENKPINEIELHHQEVGSEGYIVRDYRVLIKSHDTSTKDLIVQAEEQMEKLRKTKGVDG